MTKIQAQLYRMQIQQGVLYRVLLNVLVVKKKDWGQCKLSSNTGCREFPSFWFRRYADFRKAWFLPIYYTGNSIAAAERQILQEKSGKKTYRIIVWPARPLKGPRGSKLTPVTLYTATIRCVLCGNVLGAPRMRSKRSNTGDEKRRSGAGASTQTARQCPTRLMES